MFYFVIKEYRSSLPTQSVPIFFLPHIKSVFAIQSEISFSNQTISYIVINHTSMDAMYPTDTVIEWGKYRLLFLYTIILFLIFAQPSKYAGAVFFIHLPGR